MRAATHTFDHNGRADQAMLFLAWPSLSYYDNPRKARAYRLFQEIIGVALTEKLRDLGKTYSPSTIHHASDAFSGYGYLGISIEVRPDDLDFINLTVEELIKTILVGDIPDHILERARKSVVEGTERAQQTNAFWLSELSDYQTELRALPAQRTRLLDYRSITKAEILAVAREYVRGDRLVEVRVLPAARH